MLKPIDINEIPTRAAKGTISKEIECFLGRADSAAEVIVPPGRSAKSVYGSYISVIRKKSYPVNCIKRKGRVFLIAVKEAEETVE